jgi:hypothetical protein
MQNEIVLDAPVDRSSLTKRYTQRALEFIAQNRSRPFFLYMPQAIRSGPWKLFLPLKSLGRHPHFGTQKSTTPLLFHVVDDIGSTKNVAEQHPAVVARLMKLAERARRDLGDTDRQGEKVRPRGEVHDPKPLVIR